MDSILIILNNYDNVLLLLNAELMSSNPRVFIGFARLFSASTGVLNNEQTPQDRELSARK